MVLGPMTWAQPPWWWSWADETGITHMIRRRSGYQGYFVRCSIEGPKHFAYSPPRAAITCLWCVVDGTSP